MRIKVKADAHKGVLLVVWAWDLVIIRLHCCGPPAPARRQFFALRFATVCH